MFSNVTGKNDKDDDEYGDFRCGGENNDVIPCVMVRLMTMVWVKTVMMMIMISSMMVSCNGDFRYDGEKNGGFRCDGKNYDDDDGNDDGDFRYCQ